MTSLDTFIPPPVLPAHAPENINMTKIIFENSGHLLKSVDAYPVVVNPESVSNIASTTDGISPLITNCIAPKKLITIQLIATVKNYNLSSINSVSVLCFFVIRSLIPCILSSRAALCLAQS